MNKDKPSSRDTNDRFVKADSHGVDSIALQPHINVIMAVVKDLCDVEGAMITDESYLSDMFDPFDRASFGKLYEQFSARLGVAIDRDNSLIVDIARRLHMKGNA